MQTRMAHPAFAVPNAIDALQGVGTAIGATGLSPSTIELVNLRASQLNGCGVCADGHTRIAKKAGETDERLHTVAAWRDTPYFDEAERAALALTESITCLADARDGVPDSVWDEAARHYDETRLAALVLSIANINLWNRLNVATRQIAAGDWTA